MKKSRAEKIQTSLARILYKLHIRPTWVVEQDEADEMVRIDNEGIDALHSWRKEKCEHIWEGDSFRGIDILGKAKTISWSVCIKCGAIIGIQSIEEVRE